VDVLDKTAPSVSRLITAFARLPGVGRKTAARLAFHVLSAPEEETAELSQLLAEVRASVRSCSVCDMLTEADPCAVCSDAQRDDSVLCVVEQSRDVWAIESAGAFRGRYHVLGGRLSPLDGVGPDDLSIEKLLTRLPGDFREVVIATNPNVEGDTTAHYIAEQLSDTGVKITRIARGVPVGGDLEYADGATLARALEGRRDLD
jgi:recombination protein RecR